MNKKVFAILIVLFSVIVSGSGYKGTLPDLNTENNQPVKKQQKSPESDILPLDKLTIPVNNTVKKDKILDAYTDDMIEIIRQLERLKEVLDTDKSFKNYIAGANVLDLSTKNIISKFPEERFKKTNKLLNDINYDTQQIKNYWVKINRMSPYVTHYATNGAYSGAVLNEQLNNFSNVLGYAIRELKSDLKLD